MLTPREKFPPLENQRRVKPATLYHAGQWAQHTLNRAIPPPFCLQNPLSLSLYTITNNWSEWKDTHINPCACVYVTPRINYQNESKTHFKPTLTQTSMSSIKIRRRLLDFMFSISPSWNTTAKCTILKHISKVHNMILQACLFVVFALLWRTRQK